MDPNAFTDRSPGTLVPTATKQGRDWAFIPTPLPPDWPFPADLWPLLAEAKQELARLDGAGRHITNPELLLRPLQKLEALRSSSLEGTYSTPRELFLFELERTPGQNRDAQREVANYGQALRKAVEMLDTLPLCLRVITKMHHILLEGVRGGHKGPGEFRRNQVQIGADARFVPPPANEVPALLDNLEKAMNTPQATVDPLVDAFLVHYQFETIHPFLDGNGRVGRLLLSLLIYQTCGLSQPWLYLSPFFDEHRRDYIDTLFRVSTHGDWAAWVALCLRATIAQSRDALQRIETLITLRDRWQRQIASMGSARLVKLVNDLFDIPVLTAPHVASLFAISYPTAKADIEKLVKAGILETVPNTYPQEYWAPAIFKAVYEG